MRFPGWSAALLALILLAACESADSDSFVAEAEAAAPIPVAPEHVHAVLVAGDVAQPVFDNAVLELRRRLVAAGVPPQQIHVLTASAQAPSSGIEPATLANITRRVATLHAAAGDACFVYLTSHGGQGRGLVLARANEWLAPGDLDGALSQGCAEAATFVVASGCYSGNFATGAIARANRVILTAARADRPSFGCDVDRTYTFFDECFLEAINGGAGWQPIYVRTRRCVSALEKKLGERPSGPQVYFGKAASGFALPWPRL